MTVTAIIKKFSTRHKLPVDVQEVVEELRARGVKDEIYYFWDPELDPESMSGFIDHWEYDGDGGIKLCATITYGRASNEHQRLVCAKETLHILDPKVARVSDIDGIEHLIDKIILPPGTVDPNVESLASLTDRAAIAQALAILFPYAARSVYMPLYKEKKISLETIAEQAELPVKFVAVVMNDIWDDIHEKLLNTPELDV